MSEMAVGVSDPLGPHLAEVGRLVRWGKIVVAGGLLPVLAWLAFAPLSSAVVAPAFVKVDLNRRTVQHAEGGIVREVKVRDGQQVRGGDPLLVLGDVAVAADENRLSYRVWAERLSMARLEAEQSLSSALVFAGDVQAAAGADARLDELLHKERGLFAAHREARVSQSGLLHTQRGKVLQEITALKAQIAQAELSLQHQRADMESNRNLLTKGFIAQTRINQLEAGVADYGVKLEEKRTDLARAEQRVVEIDLKLRALDSDYRQQASDQLKVTAARLSEIEQEQRKSSDAAARQVIVAPADGEVIGLRFTAPGTVIAPREPIADIVPSDPRLVLEARVRTEDVSRITRDQPADIRFTAFKYRTTDLVRGRVSYVSADRLVDQAANLAYYSVLIEVDPASLAKSGEIRLQAGMPAEVYIKGEDRTPLQYLVEPITQVIRRAGREH
jgi:membrane fusion protein, type I secretion system